MHTWIVLRQRFRRFAKLRCYPIATEQFSSIWNCDSEREKGKRRELVKIHCDALFRLAASDTSTGHQTCQNLKFIIISLAAYFRKWDTHRHRHRRCPLSSVVHTEIETKSWPTFWRARTLTDSRWRTQHNEHTAAAQPKNSTRSIVIAFENWALQRYDLLVQCSAARCLEPSLLLSQSLSPHQILWLRHSDDSWCSQFSDLLKEWISFFGFCDFIPLCRSVVGVGMIISYIFNFVLILPIPSAAGACITRFPFSKYRIFWNWKPCKAGDNHKRYRNWIFQTCFDDNVRISALINIDSLLRNYIKAKRLDGKLHGNGIRYVCNIFHDIRAAWHEVCRRPPFYHK